MPNPRVWIAIGVLAACGGPDEHVAPDAAIAVDAAPSIDASFVDAPTDAGVCILSYPTCAPASSPQPARCAAAVPLTPAAPLTAQDSADGGYGDCAATGTGIGGPSLYYAIEVPAQHVARVRAVPTDPTKPAVVRAMSDCGSLGVLASNRGGDLTAGRAAVCVRNDDDAPQSIVVAVSQYSGEADCAPLVFDVSVEFLTFGDTCLDSE
jgi:hypothetical protein